MIWKLLLIALAPILIFGGAFVYITLLIINSSMDDDKENR
jgi:hypothetical protein